MSDKSDKNINKRIKELKSQNIDLLKTISEIKKNAPLKGYSELLLYKNQLEERFAQRTKELEKSKGNYKTIFNEATDGIIIFDNNYNIQETNSWIKEITGFNDKDFSKKNISDLFPDSELVKQPLRLDLAKKGISVIRRRSILKKNKQVFPIETNSRIMYDGRLVMFCRDISDRIEAERTISMANDIVKNIPMGLYIYQLIKKDKKDQLVMISSNPFAEKTTGISNKQVVGQSIENIFPNIQESGLLKILINVIKNNSPIELDKFKYSDKKLSKKLYNIKAFPLHESSLCVCFEDITQRNLDAEKLQQAEQRFQNIFINSQIGLFRTRIDGSRFLEANDRVAEILGYADREEFLSSKVLVWDYYVSGNDRKKMLKTLLKTGEIKNFEAQWIKKDSSIIWVRYSGKLNPEENCLDGVIEDITFEKEAYNKLKKNEEKFRNIFNSSGDGMLIFNPIKLNIIDINQIIIDKTGYSRNELINSNIHQLIPPQYTPKLKERIHELIKGKSLPATEIELYKKDSSIVPLEIISKLIEYEGQKVILTVARDITERKEFENLLTNTMIETEEKEKKRLAQDLHDEVGPLMSTLNMYVSALDSISVKEKRFEFIENIKKISQDATSTIRQISNTLSPHVLDKFGLNAAINNIINTNLELIKTNYETNINKLRFSSQIEIAFYRIIKELVNNTLKHAEANEINIKLNTSNKKLLLEYSDNGKGFNINEISENKNPGMGLYNIITRSRNINGIYSFEKKEKGGLLFLLRTEIK